MKSKMHLALVFAIVAIAALCLLNWRSEAQTSQRVVWEYKTYVIQDAATVSPNVSQLNKLGAEG